MSATSTALSAFATEIPGQPDKRVYQLARLSIGVEPLLNEAVQRLAAHVDPALADDGIVQWNLDEMGVNHPYSITITDGVASVERSAAANPRVTLTTSVPNFFRLALELSDWTDCIEDGVIHVAGDQSYLGHLGQIFREAV